MGLDLDQPDRARRDPAGTEGQAAPAVARGGGADPGGGSPVSSGTLTDVRSQAGHRPRRPPAGGAAGVAAVRDRDLELVEQGIAAE